MVTNNSNNIRFIYKNCKQMYSNTFQQQKIKKSVKKKFAQLALFIVHFFILF